MEHIVNMVEISRIYIFNILVPLDIKGYNHIGNQKLNKTCINIIVRPRELFH